VDYPLHRVTYRHPMVAQETVGPLDAVLGRDVGKLPANSARLIRLTRAVARARWLKVLARLSRSPADKRVIDQTIASVLFIVVPSCVLSLAPLQIAKLISENALGGTASFLLPARKTGNGFDEASCKGAASA